MWVDLFSSLSLSLAALLLETVVEEFVVIADEADVDPSKEQVLNNDWECGEKLPAEVGDKSPPGPYLANGLLQEKSSVSHVQLKY